MKRITLLLLLFFSLNSMAQYYVRAELYFLDEKKTFVLAHINAFNDKNHKR
jgi:hypothetical protein